MEILSQVLIEVFNPLNLGYVFLGTLVGVIVGAIPGLGSVMGMALLLPLTFGIGKISALTMLPAIYVGAMAGDVIPAVTIGIPGTPGAAADVLDGHPLALQGKGEEALTQSIFGSFGGGIISALLLLGVAGILAQFALKFGPSETLWLGVLGLSVIATLSGESLLKGFLAGFFGVFLSTIGLDVFSGVPRFTFGSPALLEGIPLIPPLIGFFALSRLFLMAEGEAEKAKAKTRSLLPSLKTIFPTSTQLKRLMMTILRASGIGTFLGALPGVGSVTSAWVSYSMERNFSKNPERFGNGAIEGLVAAETGNSAVTGGALIPLLALGIPGSASMAILLAGFRIHGLVPGPSLFSQSPITLYSIIVGVILASFFMLAIGVFLRGPIVRLIALAPNSILVPIVIVFCAIGTYGVGYNIYHVYMMVLFGIIGYFTRKHEIPSAPIILGLILGPFVERGFRQSLLIFDNPYQLFFGRYGIALGIIIFIIILQVLNYLIRKQIAKISG